MKYELKKSDSPIIMGGKVISDPGVGGIKLVYNKSTEFSLIPSNEEIVFLNPYKSIWAPEGKKSVNKNEWGSSRSPLSSVWLRLRKDYSNWNEEIERINKEESGFLNYEVIKNPEIVKHLNKQSEKFNITTSDDKPTTHLGLKITLWISNNILIPLKDIFINK